MNPAAGWDSNRHRKYSRASWVSDAEMIATIVQETRGLAQNGSVVELGCGLGNLVAAFVPVAANCIGVDQDANMLRQAKSAERIRYVHAKIEEFACPAVDVVLARNVIHYVGTDVLLRRAVGLLRPGGLLLVCQAVPPSTLSRPWHDAMHRMMGVSPAPSTDDLAASFRLHGFSSIRATFQFHRMNVNRWLEARVESEELRKKVLDHHLGIAEFPEYEADTREGKISVTVRFAIVTGLRR